MLAIDHSHCIWLILWMVMSECCWVRKQKCHHNWVRLIKDTPLYSYRSAHLVRELWAEALEEVCFGLSVCVCACVTCRLWASQVVVQQTNWNERRCASLSQHGRSICQGDITALTPHPSLDGNTEPCSTWWLISIPPSLQCIAPTSPHLHSAIHIHAKKRKYSCTFMLESLVFICAHIPCIIPRQYQHSLHFCADIVGFQSQIQYINHKYVFPLEGQCKACLC